jgi:hypothetical protein
MIKIWMILEKGFEYDDSFYGFVGVTGVREVCLSRKDAEVAVRRATASFVREHDFQMERYENRGGEKAVGHPEMESPFIVQEIELTQEFLNTVGLSDGQRTRILRNIGRQLRDIAPRAADHLETHEG